EQQQRLGVRSGGEAGIDRLPRGIRTNQLRFDPLLREELLQKTSAGGFVAGRIGGVDAQIGHQRVFGLAIKRVLLDTGRTTALQWNEDGEKENGQTRNFRFSPQARFLSSNS